MVTTPKKCATCLLGLSDGRREVFCSVNRRFYAGGRCKGHVSGGPTVVDSIEVFRGKDRGYHQSRRLRVMDRAE